MRHTPGPWTVDRPSNLEFVVKAAGRPVAYVAAGGTDSIIENAALIAAAPELLAALRRCVECLDGPISDRMAGDDLAAAGVYGALVQAGAAIAKAEAAS